MLKSGIYSQVVGRVHGTWDMKPEDSNETMYGIQVAVDSDEYFGVLSVRCSKQQAAGMEKGRQVVIDCMTRLNKMGKATFVAAAIKDNK